jgi:adiponectin receptor
MVNSFVLDCKALSTEVKNFCTRNIIHNVQKMFLRYNSLTIPSPPLISYETLPPWMRDNSFILHGHRPCLKKWNDVFHSLFYFHNQTFNIYSHLITGLIFIGMLLHTLYVRKNFYFPHLLFLCSGTFCFLSSSLFHLCFCHSPEILELGSRFDYIGILIMIYSSSNLLAFYGLYDCHLYLYYGGALSSSCCTLFCVSICCRKGSCKAANRSKRAVLFVVVGGLCGLPVLISYYLAGYPQLTKIFQAHLVLLEVVIYCLGACFFSWLIPERWSPGKFDLIFNSHNLLHITSTTAGLLHYYIVRRIDSSAANWTCLTL